MKSQVRQSLGAAGSPCGARGRGPMAWRTRAATWGQEEGWSVLRACVPCCVPPAPSRGGARRTPAERRTAALSRQWCFSCRAPTRTFSLSIFSCGTRRNLEAGGRQQRRLHRAHHGHSRAVHADPSVPKQDDAAPASQKGWAGHPQRKVVRAAGDRGGREWPDVFPSRGQHARAAAVFAPATPAAPALPPASRRGRSLQHPGR